MVNATAVLERHQRRILTRPVAESGCTTCFGTGWYFAKPGELKPCPNGCRPETSAQNRGRVTDELVIRLRMTARPTPIVTETVDVWMVGGCLECGHAAGCDCDCCPYPLPAVVGTLVVTGVGA